MSIIFKDRTLTVKSKTDKKETLQVTFNATMKNPTAKTTETNEYIDQLVLSFINGA